MKNNLAKTQQRPIQYWFEDGLVNLVMGGIFILLALYFYASAAWPDSDLVNLLNASFGFWLLASLLLGGRLIQVFKERFTYPRTGYVEYKNERGSPRRLRILLVAVTAALASGLLILLLLLRPKSAGLMPAATGVILAVMLALLGWRSGLRRYYLLSGVALLLGLGLAAGAFENHLGLALLYGLLGLLLLGMGGLLLWRYLRRNPAPAEGEQDNGA